MTSRRYRVQHRTTYEYGATMTDGYSVACLVPRDTPWQTVESSSIALDPQASEVDEWSDVFGNHVHQFGLHEPHDMMSVSADSVVAVIPRGDPVDDTPWEDVVARSATALGEPGVELGMLRSSSALVDVGVLRRALGAQIDAIFLPGRPIIETLRDLCVHIFDSFEFDPHFSNVSTPLVDVLDARRGVCQDFAHVTLGCLRAVGLAARYVSGYIETMPPPGQERLIGADASHAWVAVWTPVAGWIDLDPTNGHLPANDHVTVAWGRDYGDVIPVRGVMIGPSASQQLHVSVDVARLS